MIYCLLNNIFMFKQKSNIVKGDLLLTSDKYLDQNAVVDCISVNTTDLNVLTKVAKDLLPDDIILYKLGHPDNENTRKEISIEGFRDSIPLNFEFGQFLGIMLGDGWWDKRGYGGNNDRWCLYLADLPGYNAEFVKHFLTDVLHVENLYIKRKESLKRDIPSRWGDTVGYTYHFVGTKHLCPWLSFNFGGDRSENSSGAANKYIASHFFGDGSPMEFKLGLLNGLIATDGTIYVNHAVDNPRLGLSFTSTSKELAENMCRLYEELGVRCNMIWAKKTMKGNDAWDVYPNMIDAKVKNLFANICHLRKREIFINTPVDVTGATSKRYEDVPCPKIISEQLMNWLPSYKRKEENEYKRLFMDCRDLHNYIGIAVKERNYCVSRYMAFKIMEVLGNLDKMRKNNYQKGKDLAKIWRDSVSANKDVIITEEDKNIIYKAIDAIWPLEYEQFFTDKLRQAVMNELRTVFYRIFRKSKVKGKIPHKTISLIDDVLNLFNCFEAVSSISPSIQQWLNKFVYVDPTTAYRATAVKEICQ